MGITEIVLLVAGGIVFILSFLIPSGKGEVSEQSKELAKEEIADLVGREMESIRGHVDDVVEEAVTYAMEKTERSLERLSNEKIMAVNEYSDTVLKKIHENHEEAMFLYDMLSSKHTNLKDTVSAVNRTVKEAEEKVSSISRMADNAAAPQMQKAAEGSTVQLTGLQRAAALSSATSVSGALSPATSVSAALSAATSMSETSVSSASMSSASMSATSMSATSMAATSIPLPAGRVSFLQGKAQDGKNSNDRILELYRHGRSKVAIAKELGLGVGEVKLVIDLFQNQ